MELMEQRNAQIVSQKSSLLYPQSVFIQDSLEIRFCIFPHLFKESWVTINSERGLANILSLLSSDLDIVNTKMGLLFDAISCKYCLILDVEGKFQYTKTLEITLSMHVDIGTQPVKVEFKCLSCGLETLFLVIFAKL